MLTSSLPMRRATSPALRHSAAAALALALGAAALAPPAGAAPRTPPIVGVWLTEHGDAKMRFAPCGAALCGRIVWLKEPQDDGRPKADVNNADPAKRGRPLLGLTIFTDVRPSGDEWTGRAYNSDDGRDYDVKIKRVDDDHLTVEGCALGGLFCGNETWTRG